MAGGVAFFLTGNLAGGIWFAFIGWFLVQAARASYTELQVQQMVRGVQAQDVMAGDLVRIPPDLTLQDAVDRYFMRYDHNAFPVDEYGRTIGLMTLRKRVTMSRVKAAASFVSARPALARAKGFAAVLRSSGSPGRRGAGCGS